MIEPEPSAARLSLASGGPIALDTDEPRSLARRIAERVAAKPDGVIRSYRDDGFHQAYSHAALWRRAGDIAAALAAAGALPGAVVVILAEDILDVLPSIWACLRGGFVPVALMSAARGAVHRDDGTFNHLMVVLDNPIVVADGHYEALIARVPGRRGGRVVPLASVTPAAWSDCATIPDVAWLLATSGSSGRQKLAALSNQAVLFRNFARGQVPDPPLPNGLGTFPLDGVTGQHAAFLHHDSWTQIAPRTLMVRPTAILDAIEAFDIATVTLTTSMIRSMLADESASKRRWRLGSLRLVGLGAEPVLAGLVQDFSALIRRHGADPSVLVAGYGTTETGSLVAGSRTMLTSGADQPVRLGRPWDGISMRIVDAAGAIVPEGEVGALEVFCPAKMFSAYRGDIDASREAFTADGWWRTGDLGQLAAEELTLRGRAKDVLIQHGRKLSLTDIDAEIQQVLGVDGVGHAYRLDEADPAGEALGVVVDAGRGRAGAGAPAAIRAAIRAAIVRRFGIEPKRITAIAAADIPRTAAGKVRRAALAAVADRQAGGATLPDAPRETAGTGAAPAEPWAAPAEPRAVPAAAQAPPGAGDVASRLGAIWCEVLGLSDAASAWDHFFDLGGDSLRAVTMDHQIAEEFGIRVPSEAFFARPVFGNLVRLVRGRLAATDGSLPAPDDGYSWPLPAALRQGLSVALTHWSGERTSAQSTVVGYNLGGDRPPLFWVFNVPHEAAWLSQALGPQQPLYAMRSGYQLIDYREDEIQAFALRYVSEIERHCPAGPLFVAGNCQGGIIALAVAQHLLRRKRHIPLLVLLDWSFELQPYLGRVLLMAGRNNAHHNPRRLFARPDLAWSRAFAQAGFAEISGGYAEAFAADHVAGLSAVLQRHMQAAMLEPPALMPASAYRTTLAADDLPERLRPGGRHRVRVSVRNDGDVAWAPTAVSGTFLSSRWHQAGGDAAPHPQPRAALPGLAPGGVATVRLRIRAPEAEGDHTLVLDLVEEGNRWFGTSDAGPLQASVRVIGKAGFWSRRFG